jgi:hypothetical protein
MTDRLNPGESLQVAESLSSPNGQFSLRLQEDGNLVLYSQDGQPMWATGTDGQEVSTATMQADGNLVLYSPGGDAVWASNTFGADGAYLVLQDDGNLVIYGADGSPLWASNTSG